ncbi:MAG TPA: hypothetical protein VFI26_00255, partial [Lysobacter sp.]|nr:hypothetical protein [Lysobacter sp.]
MRAWGFWSLAAALGLSLAACSGKDHSTEVAGRIASQGGRASITVGASASSATAAKPTRFAALPDRGELLRYTAQAPIHDGAYTW